MSSILNFLKHIFVFLFGGSFTEIIHNNGISIPQVTYYPGIVNSLFLKIVNNPVLLVLIISPVIIGFSVALFKRLKNS